MVIKLSTAQSLYTKAFPVIQVSLSHFMKNSSVSNMQSMRDSISTAYFQKRAAYFKIRAAYFETRPTLLFCKIICKFAN